MKETKIVKWVGKIVRWGAEIVRAGMSVHPDLQPSTPERRMAENIATGLCSDVLAESYSNQSDSKDLLMTALDRDALYYPYIHVRDVNWLKATLLCFPNVRRIIPDSFTPRDSYEIREFCRTEGPRGPLLQACQSLHSYATAAAANKLREQLQSEEKVILSKYDQKATERELGLGADKFQIHEDKVSFDLIEYLKSKQLAWRSRDLHTDDGRNWLTLHPRLGGAVISTLAIAIAKNEGLDIVTPSVNTHLRVATHPDEDVFASLLPDVALPAAPQREGLTEDLVEVVITRTFDVSQLSPKNIADLLKNGHDLRQFKNKVAEIAAQLPDIPDEKLRRERLQYAAEQITGEWKSYRKSLPRFAVDALVDASEVKVPDLVTALVLGATTTVASGVAIGAAVLLLTHAGYKIFRAFEKDMQSPYRYLTRVLESGATLSVPVRSRQ